MLRFWQCFLLWISLLALEEGRPPGKGVARGDAGTKRGGFQLLVSKIKEKEFSITTTPNSPSICDVTAEQLYFSSELATPLPGLTQCTRASWLIFDMENMHSSPGVSVGLTRRNEGALQAPAACSGTNVVEQAVRCRITAVGICEACTIWYECPHQSTPRLAMVRTHHQRYHRQTN